MSAEEASTTLTPSGAGVHTGRWWLNPRFFVSVVLVLLLWPSLVYFYPGPVDASLDGSWPGVLQYAHLHNWQFGKDIVFTWGPWGFLNNYVHLGKTGATTKLVWETLGHLGIAIALVFFTRRIPMLVQIIFILACICFTWLFLDTIFLVLISTIVLTALLRDDTPWWEIMLALLVLGFLGQIKFTYTLFGGAGIGAATCLKLLRRQWKGAAWQAGGYGGLYVLLWWASGQNPDNLYPYLKMSLAFSSGYADAMGIDETLPVFLWGVALALTCGVFVYRLCWKHTNRSFGVITAGYLTLTWYVVWKHGYVRADSHVFAFYTYTLLIALILPSLCYPTARWHWFFAAAMLASACIEVFSSGLLARCPEVAWERTKENYRTLFHIGSLPTRWQQDYEQNQKAAQLPGVQKQVGQASIDVFNYNQGIALLNNLNYRPRPVFQSYSAYTPKLMARNLKFYQSPDAPEYILWRQLSIDAHYPTIDDALLVPELPRMYQTVGEEGDYLLLKRRPNAPTKRLERQLLLTRSLRLDDTLELPPTSDGAIWFQARLPLSKLGRLRALLYKPPTINLVVRDQNGTESVWRLLPRVAEEGFLLSPLLETQGDFASFMRGNGKKRICSLRLVAPKYQREFWSRIWDCAEIRLYKLPGLQIVAAPTFEEWVKEGITNLAPISAKANLSPETFAIGTSRALFMHAPSSIVFKPANPITQLSGTIGIQDGAFQGECHTNGVDFVVEQTLADGSIAVLFKRSLRPLQVATDRGPQSFSIALKPAAGRQIALRFLPGENDDSRWDWSYIGNLKFSPLSAP